MSTPRRGYEESPVPIRELEWINNPAAGIRENGEWNYPVHAKSVIPSRELLRSRLAMPLGIIPE